MTDDISIIKKTAELVSSIIPHRFEIISKLGDGTRIPPEALSEDHTIGIYADILPRKIRENINGYRDVEVADFLPQLTQEQTPTGVLLEWFLEYPPLRGVRFRPERLQFIEDGWWAVTAEVKYPAYTALAILYSIKKLYGKAKLLLNAEIPMPLLVRPSSPEDESQGTQVVIQARGEGRILYTNIHTECTLAYARQWSDAVHNYYRIAEPEI